MDYLFSTNEIPEKMEKWPELLKNHGQLASFLTLSSCSFALEPSLSVSFLLQNLSWVSLVQEGICCGLHLHTLVLNGHSYHPTWSIPASFHLEKPSQDYDFTYFLRWWSMLWPGEEHFLHLFEEPQLRLYLWHYSVKSSVIFLFFFLSPPEFAARQGMISGENGIDSNSCEATCLSCKEVRG